MERSLSKGYMRDVTDLSLCLSQRFLVFITIFERLKLSFFADLAWSINLFRITFFCVYPHNFCKCQYRANIYLYIKKTEPFDTKRFCFNIYITGLKFKSSSDIHSVISKCSIASYKFSTDNTVFFVCHTLCTVAFDGKWNRSK